MSDAELQERAKLFQSTQDAKVSELARVSSERTALQVQVDKQAKAAREEALLGACDSLRLSVPYFWWLRLWCPSRLSASLSRYRWLSLCCPYILV